jgi:DNA primase
VEGYTDVMSLHESGIENVVASSGTSLTQEQVRLIKRFTPNITILYDGDAAGIKASIRGIDIVLEEGMNVKIVLLPDGEDPDSYSKKKSNEEFTKYIKENETDFIRFKTRLLLAEANNDPVKKADLIRDVVKSIAVIPETITRTVYIKECSTLLEMAEPILYHEVNKLRQQKSFPDRNRYPSAEDLPIPPPVIIKPVKPESVALYSEKEVIRLLLKFGNLEFERIISKDDGSEETVTIADYIVREIVSDELSFENTVCAKIFSEIKFNVEHGLFAGDRQFVKHEDPEISSLSADLLADSHELSKIWQEKLSFVETEEMKIKEIVSDVVLKFKSDKIIIKRKEIMLLLEEAVKANDTDRALVLQKRYSILSTALGMISKQLGNRIVL